MLDVFMQYLHFASVLPLLMGSLAFQQDSVAAINASCN
ncbi:hypothetical protein MNNICLKF_02424 [Synechococcus sp. CBW1107]|nr:hypothetical protein MNNICLKF_02424 [Synechococcus sp. CBW1107]